MMSRCCAVGSKQYLTVVVAPPDDRSLPNLSRAHCAQPGFTVASMPPYHTRMGALLSSSVGRSSFQRLLHNGASPAGVDGAIVQSEPSGLAAQAKPTLL